MQNHLLENQDIDRFESLYTKLENVYIEENYSLLHGDLWSGNYICDRDKNPVLIDPAVYYGSRHMDLAMTTLFGGFDKKFYEVYNHYHPLPSNYRMIWDICNLYPLLIHLNLFGRSYLSSILSIIRQF